MKNLKKMSREDLKMINGGNNEEPCGVGQLLCYGAGCILMCMNGTQCKPSFCIE